MTAARYSSVRYSGDATVRLGYDPRRDVYAGTVADPYVVWRGRVGGGTRTPRRSSAAYDDAAERLIRAADRWAARTGRRPIDADRRLGRLRIRRVFQAPCPV